jgi:hypothetical protein
MALKFGLLVASIILSSSGSGTVRISQSLPAPNDSLRTHYWAASRTFAFLPKFSLIHRLRGGSDTREEQENQNRLERYQDIQGLSDLWDGVTRESESLPCSHEGTVEKKILRVGKEGSQKPHIGDFLSIKIEIWSKGILRMDTNVAIEDAFSEKLKEREDSLQSVANLPTLPDSDEQMLPPHLKYAYGGKILPNCSITSCSGVTGCFSFQLGPQAGASIITPGVETAILTMSVGEVASISLCGDVAFDSTEFSAVGRELGIEQGACVDVYVELVAVNVIDVTRDEGVVLAWKHGHAALMYERLTKGDWRILLRRPSMRARVLLRASRSLLQQMDPKHVNMTSSNEVWVPLGSGQLPMGIEMALTHECVRDVEYTITLRRFYRKKMQSVFCRDDEGVDTTEMTQEWRFERQEDTYTVMCMDWDEVSQVVAEHDSVVLVQHSIAKVKTNLRPVSDGDDVTMHIRAMYVPNEGAQPQEFLPWSRHVVSIGEYVWPAGLEKALLGLRQAQLCTVTLRGDYVKTLIWNQEADQVTFGPALSGSLTPVCEIYEIRVEEIRTANYKTSQEQITMARRRRAVANLFFAQNNFQEALAVYRQGLAIVVGWEVHSEDDGKHTATLSLSSREWVYVCVIFVCMSVYLICYVCVCVCV